MVGWIFAAFVIVFIVTAVAHYLNGGIRVQTPFQRVTPQVKAHLSVLLGVLALVKAAGYYLQQFSARDLDAWHRRRADVHRRERAAAGHQAAAGDLALLVALFLYNIFRRGWVLPVLGVGLWAFVAVVAGTIVPAFIQQFRVEPSESTKERPYIERNIEATKAAMNLDDVAVKDFANDNQLNTQAIVDNQTTVRNIRLWDPSPNISLKTFQTLQSLKPFYKIDDVDVDRYDHQRSDDAGLAVLARAEHRRRAAEVMGRNAPRVHPRLRPRARAVERADTRGPTRLPRAGHPDLEHDGHPARPTRHLLRRAPRRLCRREHEAT